MRQTMICVVIFLSQSLPYQQKNVFLIFFNTYRHFSSYTRHCTHSCIRYENNISKNIFSLNFVNLQQYLGLKNKMFIVSEQLKQLYENILIQIFKKYK